MSAGCFSYPGGMEICRLQKYIFCVFSYTGIFTAEYTCYTHSLFTVAYHQVLIAQFTLLIIKGCKVGLFRKCADNHLITFNICSIKCMHWVACFIQNEIGDIHYIINGTQTNQQKFVL